MLHSQELTNLGSNSVHPGSKSNLLYILLCFQICLEIKVPIANAFVSHIFFTLKERLELQPQRPWAIMIKFIDNNDQEITAQVFGSSRGRFHQKIGKSICEIFALCHCAFIQLLLSHSISILPSDPPHLLWQSSTYRLLCACTHTHTQRFSCFSITRMQQTTRVFHSLSIFNLLMCCLYHSFPMS